MGLNTQIPLLGLLGVVVLPAGQGGWGELVSELAGNSGHAAVVLAALVELTLHGRVALGFTHEQLKLVS